MGFIQRRVGLQRKRKPKGPTAIARSKRARTLREAEGVEKATVRRRDKHCRFPRCGCRSSWGLDAMKRVPTVSHDFHKGMGGDPTGGVSIAPLMILLCKWRHQDAPVSRHAGTMQTRYLTPDNNDGPVEFLVDLFAVYPGRYERKGMWFIVATEVERGVLGELTVEQRDVLHDLTGMER